MVDFIAKSVHGINLEYNEHPTILLSTAVNIEVATLLIKN
jgi:hypothetical protein